MAPDLGFRYRADARSVMTILATVALLFAPHFVAISDTAAAAWIAATFLLCCASHVIVHNHVHCPIFRSNAANRVLNLVATVARGHCVSDVYVAHNINHHIEQGRSGDWIAPSLGGKGHPLARLARFTILATLSMLRERRRLGKAARGMLPEPFQSSLPWEKALLPMVAAGALMHGWETFLIFQLLPWTASLLWLVGVNFVQHDGCDPESKYGHSRNFTGRFTNWLLFNNGYHTAHHLEPALHWSEVPAAHARLAGRIPASLSESSATRFMLRRYLFPRRRNFPEPG